MIATVGKVIDEKPGAVVISTTRPAVDNLSDSVEILWSDSRLRSPEQIRKAWALMTEIAEFQGEDKEYVYKEQAMQFSAKSMEQLQGKLFHLSTASVSEARSFINLLVEIIIEYGIPTKEPLYGLCDDINRYAYVCLIKKKCCICGRKAELHHVDAVGMGYDRREKCQIGNRVMALCREHHMEWHSIGGTSFEEKYHIVPGVMDQKMAVVYGLTKKARGEDA